MAKKITRQESKEFQLKLDLDALLGKARRTPGKTDEAIFLAVTEAVDAAVVELAAGGKSKAYFINNLWRREGIRYDTAEKLLKRCHLTLAVEATDTLTKLKCKGHEFVPELLFAKPKQSPCYPDRDATQGKVAKAKFKLEQDLHFDNHKFCASGSLFAEGRRTDAADLGFFSRYFPGLLWLAPATTPLEPVSHWDEAVFDEMLVGWDKVVFDDWMLVNRWQWDKNRGSHQLLEAELSFKVEKPLDADWDYRQLHHAGALYLALQASGLFVALPPIFTFDNPVSSIDIRPA
jgi:hypothetical protein